MVKKIKQKQKVKVTQKVIVNVGSRTRRSRGTTTKKTVITPQYIPQYIPQQPQVSLADIQNLIRNEMTSGIRMGGEVLGSMRMPERVSVATSASPERPSVAEAETMTVPRIRVMKEAETSATPLTREAETMIRPTVPTKPIDIRTFFKIPEKTVKFTDIAPTPEASTSGTMPDIPEMAGSMRMDEEPPVIEQVPAEEPKGKEKEAPKKREVVKTELIVDLATRFTPEQVYMAQTKLFGEKPKAKLAKFSKGNYTWSKSILERIPGANIPTQFNVEELKEILDTIE